MNYKKILSLLALFLLAPGILNADEISDMKANIGDMVTKLIAKYEARIQVLEAENAELKGDIARLKWTTVASVVVPTPAPAILIPTIQSPSVLTPGMTKTDMYSAVMKSINEKLPSILKENALSGSGAIGLFEFIEPNAVFISIDDGMNPAGITAFKTKIAYTFDTNLSLTRVGLFDLDYETQMYRTVSWSNPYTKSVRVRVQNPLYKGKLLELSAMGDTGTPSSAANTPTESTLAQIQAAYDKNKNLDALKLSDSYILKNPNDLAVLKIRYRSYYMIGKYESSLQEIKKIETLTGAAFDKTIACDAAVIGKIAKKLDVSDYYGAICKKK